MESPADHDFLGHLRLLLTLTEIDDGVEVNDLSMLKGDLESPLIIWGFLTTFPESDNDVKLRDSAVSGSLQLGRI
jgi:hypothetical protein